MPNINDFKAKLAGGGARANQFKVTMPFPGYAQVGGEIEDLAFLCRSTTIPAMNVGVVEVPFRGRNVFYPGDRPDPGDWTTTFYNDTDFMIRNAMERWSNGINDFANNTGLTNPADFQTDLQVEQLDRDDTILKTYILRNCFPTSIAEIALDMSANDAIETFGVTWKYTHLEASGVNF